MIQQALESCLRPVIEAESRLLKRRATVVLLLVGALGLLVFHLLGVHAGWWDSRVVLLFLGLLAAAALAIPWFLRSRQPDLRDLARRVEEAHPDLRVRLLTALDQEPGPDGKIGYLQSVLIGDVTDHAIENRWVRRVSQRKLRSAGWLQFLAVVAFCLSAAWLILGDAGKTSARTAKNAPEEDPAAIVTEIAVTPGDTEVERGSRLVVGARFSGELPTEATLVLFEPDEAGSANAATAKSDGDSQPDASGKIRGTLPMQPGLDEAEFSAHLDRLDSDTGYRVHFADGRSPDYRIHVYEHPRLERADATIEPPDYQQAETRIIENTRKASVMEGGAIAWRLKINHPVAAAEFFGEDGSILPLEADPEDPTVLLARLAPDKTQKYRLHLVDAESRANKNPPWFTMTVKRNLPPELKFQFPSRDTEVTTVQELPVEATAWDDLGLLRAGIVFQHNGKEEEIVLADAELPGGEHHELSTLFPVEKLGAAPRDLISYHLWAEDRDAENAVRRTTSDMFFAEVRHFENIFREGAAGGGPGGGGRGNIAQRLLDLQKDVLNAAWKLDRNHQLGRGLDEMAEDIATVKESQGIVQARTGEALPEIQDPQLVDFFKEAIVDMQGAIDSFDRVLAKHERDDLLAAHGHARSAMEKLVQARAREHQVTRSQSSQGGGKSPQQQQQLDNLELQQKELKYEEERHAKNEPESAEQKENLAVLNRLKELARRQEAVAEKIKELETALREAESEEERQEIERQLERLREEQEQLLRDLDDLSERMDRPENRSRMSRQREQLQETRENMQQASEQMRNQDLAGASNSATRAKRELAETEEEFREQTARQFASEMEDLRESARDLAERQEQLGERARETGERSSGRETTPEEQEEARKLSGELERQAQDFADLVERLKELSLESESSEPLLSDALYEAVREASLGGIQESLEEASRYLRYDRGDQALVPERAAARGIEQLKEDVEKAAERVLGSEADALRLARSEVDRLIDEAEQEAERLGGGDPGDPSDPSDRSGESDRVATGSPSDQPGQQTEPGQKKQGQSGPSDKSDSSDQSGPSDRQASAGGDADAPRGEASGEPSEQAQAGQPGQQGQPSQGEPSQSGQQGQPSEQAQTGQPGQPGQGEPSDQSDRQASAGEDAGAPRGQQTQAGPSGQGQGEPSDLSDPSDQSESAGGATGDDGPRLASPSRGGDDRGGGLPQPGTAQTPRFFDRAEETRSPGPITGEDYRDWADRLGNVEEMLSSDDLRNQAARILDDARTMRIDSQRDNRPPEADEIGQRITMPLVELRQRIGEELAKLNKENPLAPIDRDPVPGEFRELVRRYYEQLGSGR